MMLDRIRNQFIAAGYPSKQAKAFTVLIQANAKVYAHNTGRTVQEYLSKYVFNVRRGVRPVLDNAENGVEMALASGFDIGEDGRWRRAAAADGVLYQSVEASLANKVLSASYSQDSLLRNVLGKPKVLFHATRTHIDSFPPLSHFGSAKAANRRLSFLKNVMGDKLDGARLVPVHLKITNPIRLVEKEANNQALLWHAVYHDGKYPELQRTWDLRTSLPDALRDAGYDGIVYQNSADDGEDSYIILSGDQAVSALSEDISGERGQAAVAALDLAVALSGVSNTEEAIEAAWLWDEKGVESPYFRRWFGDSGVVDKDGRPLVLYHGTNRPSFDSFDPKRIRMERGEHFSGTGFNFTTDKAIALRYAGAASNETLDRKRTLAEIDRVFPPFVGEFARTMLDVGYDAAWSLPDIGKRFREYSQDNPNFDPNELSDVLQWVDGSMAQDERDELSTLFSTLSGTQGRYLPEWLDVTMAQLGLFDSMPYHYVPRAEAVYLKAENILYTSDSNESASAFENGYDAVCYSGDDTVEGVPEWRVKDPSQIKSKHNLGTFNESDDRILFQPAVALDVIDEISYEAVLNGVLEGPVAQHWPRITPELVSEDLGRTAEEYKKTGDLNHVELYSRLSKNDFLTRSLADYANAAGLDGQVVTPDIDREPPIVQEMGRIGEGINERSGVIDSKAFREWFGDSKVVDEDGLPMMVFRGEHGFYQGEDIQSRVGSITFSSAPAASIYAESPNNSNELPLSPRIVPAYLRIANPIVNDPGDPFIEFSSLMDAVGMEKAWEYALNHADYILATNNWEEHFAEKYSSLEEVREQAPERLSDLYMLAFPLLDDPRVISDLKEAGFDGAIYAGYGESHDPEFRVFDQAQIKSPFNGGSFSKSDPRILFQSGLGFYSPLYRAVEGFDFKAMPAAHLLQRIRKTQGIKQEELEDLGLVEWLEGFGDTKISKEQVLGFILQGGPQLEEVVKRDIATEDGLNVSYNPDSDNWEVWDGDDLLDEYEEESSADNHVAGLSRTKYANYQLPGGKDYREVLIRIPRNTESLFNISEDGPAMDYLDERGIRYSEEDDPTEIANQHIKSIGGPPYPSSHWDETDVLVHLRLNDRTNAKGERTLFIEEIQSDWHQMGRKQGYKQEPSSRAKAFAASVRKEALELFGENAPPVEYGHLYLAVTDARQAILKSERPEDHGQRYNKLNNLLAMISNYQDEIKKTEGVPDAPFKKSWPMLAFKRVLRMAVKQGYDSIAWTPGEVQSARYDHSKQVKSVVYNHDRGDLLVEKIGSNIQEKIAENVSKERLPDFIGKDAAEKMLEAEVHTSNTTGQRWSVLTGLDLRVGGEGMKGFYDKILTKEVGNYVKRIDKKAKVFLVETMTAERSEAGRMLASGEIESFDEMSHEQVWSLPITDKIRMQVLAGQPLYQDSRAMVRIAESGRAALAFFDNSDVSSGIHEPMHVFRQVLEDMARAPGCPDQVRQDWISACEYVGAIPGRPWTPTQEEKFAEAGERYISEGQAPSTELESVFELFRQWLRKIVECLMGYPELNDDIRGVYDRLFAICEEPTHSSFPTM